MLNDYLEAARLLREKKQSFVLATVVRTGGHTSAKSGAKAIVTEDGSLVGWVGGSCAEPTVVRESRAALRDGKPRLIRLSPPEELGKGPKEGIVEVAQTCVSGGTLEIYIEPHLPRPHLVAVGHLPITEVLVNLGKDMGYEVTVMSPLVDATKFQRADRVVDHLDFSKLDIRRDTAIVVASHANYDEEALESALATEAAYVSLVASRKRAADVIQYLRQARVPEEQLSRLKNPAGIDLGGSASLNAAGPHANPLSAPSLLARELPRADGSGSPFRLRSLSPLPASADPPEPGRRRAGDFAPAGRLRTPEEIALSIMAEIVMLRRQGQLAPGAPQEDAGEATPSERAEAIDPVCGMSVEVASARHVFEHGGERYCFCCSGCQRAFEREPGSYAVKR